MRSVEFVRIVSAASVLAAAPVVSAVTLYVQFAQPGAASSGSELGGVRVRPLDNGPAPLAGQNVVSSDGARVGEVTGIKSSSEGIIQRMYFRTGGFLGFGRRTVAVPAGRITVTGQDVILNMSSRDISNLPEMVPSRG